MTFKIDNYIFDVEAVVAIQGPVFTGDGYWFTIYLNTGQYQQFSFRYYDYLNEEDKKIYNKKQQQNVFEKNHVDIITAAERAKIHQLCDNLRIEIVEMINTIQRYMSDQQKHLKINLYKK